MGNNKKRIAVCTGGGDAPGLNAVIRAIVLAAVRRGWEVLGIQKGYTGLLDTSKIMQLDVKSVRGITHLGGTILGTTNKGQPFEYPVKLPSGETHLADRSDEVMDNFRRLKIDALISIGGDGSMRIAQRFFDKGMPVIGVPKTIDNDLSGTVTTFGFDTAVTVATDALDRLHSTAEAHERVMVVDGLDAIGRLRVVVGTLDFGNPLRPFGRRTGGAGEDAPEADPNDRVFVGGFLCEEDRMDPAGFTGVDQGLGGVDLHPAPLRRHDLVQDLSRPCGQGGGGILRRRS